MEKHRIEEELIVISVKRKKNVVTYFINLTMYEPVKQKGTLLLASQSNYSRKNSMKEKNMLEYG